MMATSSGMRAPTDSQASSTSSAWAPLAVKIATGLAAARISRSSHFWRADQTDRSRDVVFTNWPFSHVQAKPAAASSSTNDAPRAW